MRLNLADEIGPVTLALLVLAGRAHDLLRGLATSVVALALSRQPEHRCIQAAGRVCRRPRTQTDSTEGFDAPQL